MARIVCSINLKVAAFFFAVSAGYCLGFVIKADTGRRGSWRQDAASVSFRLPSSVVLLLPVVFLMFTHELARRRNLECLKNS